MWDLESKAFQGYPRVLKDGTVTKAKSFSVLSDCNLKCVMVVFRVAA